MIGEYGANKKQQNKTLFYSEAPKICSLVADVIYMAKSEMKFW